MSLFSPVPLGSQFLPLVLAHFIRPLSLFAIFGCGVAAARSAEATVPAAKNAPVPNAASGVAQQFRFAGYTGSFATKTGQQLTIGHGAQDAQLASSPASTFKVFLALVALQTGELKSADEIVPWNRKPYPNRPEWQNDMALRDAMQTSSESYFQVLAERIGRARIAAWVRQLGYGNLQLGVDPKLAWHDGVFLINTAQQVDWMHRLQMNQLPIKPAHLKAVKKALLEPSQTNAQFEIYSKTGTSLPSQGAGLGWWIGFVENLQNPQLSCSFALKVNLSKIDDRQQRIAFGKKLLRQMGCLPIESTEKG